jgi:hypothetical protein
MELVFFFARQDAKVNLEEGGQGGIREVECCNLVGLE